MVSLRLGIAAACRTAGGASALILWAACGRGETAATGGDVEDTTATGVAARLVRARYTARDMVAAGAWTWASQDGAIYVLVDAQSTIEDLVQGRAELWVVADTLVQPVGRSDVMSSAAEFGAFAFEDLTGDGLPDFFGYIADSAGVSFPVFIPGARGGMIEELAAATPGWRFAVDDPSTPVVVRGAAGPCALQVWTEDSPDGGPDGWRYLSLRRDGSLGAPQLVAPNCEAGGTAGP